MTTEDLRRWQHEMGYTYDTAAAALGIGRQTYSNWISGRSPIPHTADLACAAIIEQLAPYSSRIAHTED